MHARLVLPCAVMAVAACQQDPSPGPSPVGGVRTSERGAQAQPPVRVTREVLPARTVPPTAPRQLPTATERAIGAARVLPGDTPLRVTLTLQEPDTWPVLPPLAASQRREAMRASHDGLFRQLGDDVVVHWLVPNVTLDVPAARVASLARHPSVRRVTLSGELREEQFDGAEARRKTGTGVLVRHGVSGQHGGRAGGRMTLGVVEYNGSGLNWLGRTFHGLQDDATGHSRILDVLDCRSGECATTTEDATVDNHGTKVTGIAVASIEEGQDPHYPGAGTREQVQRSGQAPEAEVVFYSIDTCDDITSALEDMVLRGVDVANFSFGEDSARCDPAYDCGGVNAAIGSAVDAGLVIVKSGGNSEADAAACRMTWPAFRSEVISVAALDSWMDWLPYAELELWPNSAPGGVAGRARGDHVYELAGLALSAPGVWRRTFHLAPGTYNEDGAIVGTSFAAPAVSGAAVLVRQGLTDLGWPGHEAPLAMLTLLLSGDGWSGDPAWTTLRAGISTTTGFGRFRAVLPSDDSLQAPWAWGWRRLTLHPGETHAWPVVDAGPEPAGLDSFSAVLMWLEPDLTDLHDVVLSVHNTCAPFPPELIAGDWSFDLRKRVHLEGAEVAGRCLEVRVSAYDVPPEGLTVWAAEMFHAGLKDPG